MERVMAGLGEGASGQIQMWPFLAFALSWSVLRGLLDPGTPGLRAWQPMMAGQSREGDRRVWNRVRGLGGE